MVSASRKIAVRRTATAEKELVAGRVPEVSLTFLKSSRSTYIAAPVVPAASIAGQKLFDPVCDEAAIGQAREWIVQCLVAKFVGLFPH